MHGIAEISGASHMSAMRSPAGFGRTERDLPTSVVAQSRLPVASSDVDCTGASLSVGGRTNALNLMEAAQDRP